MLDQQILRNNLDALKDNLERRGLNIDVDFLVQQDEKKRAIKFEAEKARSEQKNIGKEISQSEGTKKEELLKKASVLSENVKLLNEKYETEEKLFLEQWIKIPNLVDETSPTGATDQDNKEIKKVGEIKEIENIKNHLEIGESLNLIDVEKAAEVSGSRFSYIFGDLVKIELNLVSWVLEKLSSKEFTPTVPPVLVREEALFGTGFFPDDAEQVYEIPKDDLFLVGTSEVPLAALHANEILNLETLPLRYAGFSTCFRREAGTYGKDTTGIFRVHQFDKVEMFSFCNPEKSKDEHEYLLSVEEEILQELEIP